MNEKNDVTKLPRWAQNRIEKLEADVLYYSNQMVEMVAEGKEALASNVLLPYFKGDMHDQYLPKNTRVQFLMPHPWVESRPGYIEVRHQGEDTIDIHGSQPIWIEPGLPTVAKSDLGAKTDDNERNEAPTERAGLLPVDAD